MQLRKSMNFRRHAGKYDTTLPTPEKKRLSHTEQAQKLLPSGMH